ncbi:MAG: CapA family protein [Treponema sp.]|nr:CapA family protein [Treponema sp.]
MDYRQGDATAAAFVRNFLADTERLEALSMRLHDAKSQEAPDIRVVIFSEWQSEAPDGAITLTRTWFVPREDPLAERTGTTFARCLSGEETLVPVADLAPPFIALRVDGLTISDAGYPLVKTTGVALRLGSQDALRKVGLDALFDRLAVGLRVSGTDGGTAWPRVSGTDGGTAWARVSGTDGGAAWPRVSGTGGGAAWPQVSGTEPKVPAKNTSRDAQRTAGLDATLDRLTVSLLEAATRSKVSDPRPTAVFWIAAGGDVLLDRGADRLLLAEGPRAIFGETAAYIAGADLALINLECAVTDRGSAVPKSYNFRASPVAMRALRDAGVDAVLLANNHVFDFGEIGFLDTLSHVKGAGIGTLGVGLNERDAAAPFLFGEGGEGKPLARIFGLASFPREKNGWDGLTVAATAGKAGLLHAGKGGAEQIKANVVMNDEALDIVLFHGGSEWSDEPDAKTRALYSGLIESGVDLFFGSHPQVVLGLVGVGGRPVFWSLGDYVFGDMQDTRLQGGEDGLFIMLGFWGKRLLYLEPYPVTLADIRTSIAPREKLRRFYTLSRNLRDRFF